MPCATGLRAGLVSCCDQGGNTALLVACASGRLDVARWLVTDAGSDARSERSIVSCRSLLSASLCFRVVSCATKFCGLVSCCDQIGDTALLTACAHGYLDVARWLVTDAGSDAQLERDNVSSHCSFRCGCASMLRRERRCFVLGVMLSSVWQYSPSGGMCQWSP